MSQHAPAEYYFAYGSNLWLPQMEARCPGVSVVGPATLTGFQVAFIQPHAGWGGGVAGLVPAQDEVVIGVVYAVSAENLRSLDDHEPTADGRYWRERHPVTLTTGAAFAAWTYNGHVADGAPFAPSTRYLDTIVRGAEAHGLPAAYIHALQQRAQSAPA